MSGHSSPAETMHQDPSSERVPSPSPKDEQQAPVAAPATTTQGGPPPFPDGGFRAWATVLGGYVVDHRNSLSSTLTISIYPQLAHAFLDIRVCHNIFRCNSFSNHAGRYTNSFGVYQGIFLLPGNTLNVHLWVYIDFYSRKYLQNYSSSDIRYFK